MTSKVCYICKRSEINVDKYHNNHESPFKSIETIGTPYKPRNFTPFFNIIKRYQVPKGQTQFFAHRQRIIFSII